MSMVSLVLVHHMILRIRLFFFCLHLALLAVVCSLQLGLDEGRKNSRISKPHMLRTNEIAKLLIIR